MDRDTLIAELEKATGPDRYLDFRIHALSSDASVNLDRSDDCYGSYWSADKRRYVTVPLYTATIDAAIGLVPEGWAWSCGSCARENHAWVAAQDRDTDGIEGFGATPAIALCIAALRAVP